jgi:hypothetical protein
MFFNPLKFPAVIITLPDVGGNVENRAQNSGNFMLQALLMLAIVIGFLPVFANKISSRARHRENAAVVAQIAFAFDAARAFVYEESRNFPDGIKVFSGDDFVNALEPFGLPLGFVPTTPLGQSISLAVSKKGNDMLAILRASGGRPDDMRRAEILSRIGFWGAVIDGGAIRGATGGWEILEIPNNMKMSQNDIIVRVPEDEEFSELVMRRAKNPEKNVFHTDLQMDGNNVGAAAVLTAMSGGIKNVIAGDFRLSGIEADRKNKNDIGTLRAGKVWFSDSEGSPLSIVRADLRTGTFSAGSIAGWGDRPVLVADNVSVREFNMSAGRTGFAGPAEWDIKTNASFTNITLSVEKLAVSSFVDTSRGQDVYFDESSGETEAATGSGIRTDTIKADSITLRDQISSELLAGGAGAAIIDIRPAGTSVLPDAQVDGISGDALKIPLAAADNSGKTESCRAIITRLGGKYNSASLAGSIVCQFVMYNRIERRIDIKKCLMGGGANCL